MRRSIPSVVVFRVLQAVLIFVLFGVMCSATQAADPVNVPTGQRQLFLDDYVVTSTTGLAKTMHQPEKMGAVVVPDQPWEMTLQTRSAPQWDAQAQKYKLWMITSVYQQDTSPPEPDPTFGAVSYAESTDGITWTKPILNQWACWGSKENNFLDFPTHSMQNVVYDPLDPDPSRRFKGLQGATVRYPAVSADGYSHWPQLSVPTVPSGDESNMSYDRDSGTFIATLKQNGPYGRAQGIWTSTDFDTWTNTGVVFAADAQDQLDAAANIAARLADPTLQQPLYNNPADYNADIYNMGIFEYEGQYIGMPSVYYRTGTIPSGGDDGFHNVQLASSRDLTDWERLGDRQAFIGPSPTGEGAYDLTQILPPSAPVVHGDELWFYYTGIKYRAMPETPDVGVGAVCLAVLRRDGFISLDAGAEQGTLLTKPFVLSDEELFVNVDATSGLLTVEVLDDTDTVVGVSEAIVGDRLDANVQWSSGDLADFVGQTISLRFTLQDASFYSFWTAPVPEPSTVMLLAAAGLSFLVKRRRK